MDTAIKTAEYEHSQKMNMYINEWTHVYGVQNVANMKDALRKQLMNPNLSIRKVGDSLYATTVCVDLDIRAIDFKAFDERCGRSCMNCFLMTILSDVFKEYEYDLKFIKDMTIPEYVFDNAEPLAWHQTALLVLSIVAIGGLIVDSIQRRKINEAREVYHSTRITMTCVFCAI
jgi:hypothetical protein